MNDAPTFSRPRIERREGVLGVARNRPGGLNAIDNAPARERPAAVGVFANSRLMATPAASQAGAPPP